MAWETQTQINNPPNKPPIKYPRWTNRRSKPNSTWKCCSTRPGQGYGKYR